MIRKLLKLYICIFKMNGGVALALNFYRCDAVAGRVNISVEIERCETTEVVGVYWKFVI